MVRAWDLTISASCGYRDTMDSNDLERSAATKGNLGELEGIQMVRMFKRLLRSGSRQRVVGQWVF